MDILDRRPIATPITWNRAGSSSISKSQPTCRALKKIAGAEIEVHLGARLGALHRRGAEGQVEAGVVFPLPR